MQRRPTTDHHHHLKNKHHQLADHVQNDEDWERIFKLLHNFVEREGHCRVEPRQCVCRRARDTRPRSRSFAHSPVPLPSLSLFRRGTRSKEEGERLGLWIHHQRSAQKSGKLGTRRQGRLEDLGLSWEFVVPEGAWRLSHEELKNICGRFKAAAFGTISRASSCPRQECS